MKKVIFICLLSLSMCLSKPTDVSTDKPATQHGDATTPAQITPAPTKETEKVSSPPPTHPQENSASPSGNAKNISTAVTTAPVTEKADNGVTTKPNEITTASTPASSSKPTPTDKPSPLPPTTQKPAPADHDKSSSTSSTTTTVKPEPSKPTETPKEGDKIVQARGFDGASFIGGIILTLGLLAIGFMGFKYYKNQTERNYHTL